VSLVGNGVCRKRLSGLEAEVVVFVPEKKVADSKVKKILFIKVIQKIDVFGIKLLQTHIAAGHAVGAIQTPRFFIFADLRRRDHW
jgi:hypothetical protein